MARDRSTGPRQLRNKIYRKNSLTGSWAISNISNAFTSLTQAEVMIRVWNSADPPRTPPRMRFSTLLSDYKENEDA
jgi:hypothetical protein